MPTLPATGYIENASRTVAEIKAALEALRDVASVLPGGAARPELTIASGVVTPATRDHGGHIRIDTESDASSDDLDIVAQTNTYAGQRLRLYAENASRVVTVKHGNGGAGELLMVDAADFVLDSLDKWIEFERRSTSWVEVERSREDFVGDSGSGGISGLVPAPGAGEQHRFLRGDGGWEKPAVATAAQATTSGRSVSFSSIPAWVTQIVVGVSGVSSNGGTDPLGLRLGTGGSDTTSGYLGAVQNATGSATANHNTLFQLTAAAAGAANLWHGAVILELTDPATNTWSIAGAISTSNATGQMTFSGSVTLSGVLDIVTFRLGGSTDNFDAGKVNVRYS